MSIALYRRYRPETFQEVIGQDHVVQPLMAALEAGRTTHAYLFSGPRGCGKTTSARILARALNCVEYPTSTPCGTCDSCVELARDSSGSLDVVEMDAASHGGVDDARELREQAGFAPVRDRYKIFIIDEAHMVTNQGFNALLKLVEEPPEHVKFIFATTEPEKVIGTIRSRTHHYPFRLVPPLELENYLGTLTQAEGVTAGHDLLSLVVRAGTGSVRDTLSVLDQIIGGSQGSVLDYDRAVALLGFTSANLLDDAVGAIADRDGAGLFGVVDSVVKSGHDPRRFVEDLLQRLRDLVIISLAGEEAKDVFVSVPEDQYGRMNEQATKLGGERASQCADLTNDALSDMAGATAPRLQLELLCARLIVAKPDGIVARSHLHNEPEKPSAEVAENLAKFTKPSEPQRQSGGGEASGKRQASMMDPRNRPMPSISSMPEPETSPPETRTQPAAVVDPTPSESDQRDVEPGQHPVASDEDAPGSGPLDTIVAAWDSIASDQNLSRIARVQLEAANGPVAVEGDALIVGFDQPGVANAFTARGAREIAHVLSTRLGLNLRVEGRAGGESQAPKARAAQVAAPPEREPLRPTNEAPVLRAVPSIDSSPRDTDPVMSAPSPMIDPPASSAESDSDTDILGSAAEYFPGPPPAAFPGDSGPKTSDEPAEVSTGDTESSSAFEDADDFEDFPMPPPMADPFEHTVTGSWAPTEPSSQRGYTDVVDPDEDAGEPVEDDDHSEWEGASADDPEISHSPVVGLQVVLDRFDAKVIEERTED